MNTATLITDRRHSIGKAALEGSILACIKDWAETHPDEVVALQRQVAVQRATQKPGTGDGAVMLHSQVPVSLWKSMQRRIDRRWMDDDWTYKKFISLFRIGMVNPSLPYRRGW